MWLRHGNCAQSLAEETRTMQDSSQASRPVGATVPGRRPRPASTVARGEQQCTRESRSQAKLGLGHIYAKWGSLGAEEGAEDSRSSLGTAVRLCRPALPASLGPCLSLVSHRQAGVGPSSVDIAGL